MNRLSLPREFLLPNDVAVLKVADKASDAVAYIWTDKSGRPCARVFYGRQSKPVFSCHYRAPAQREAAVVRAFEARRARAAAKARYAADRKASALKPAVGDVLSTCWGYDQTNREFYQVVRVKGANVTVRQIAAETVATGDMTARVIPLPGEFIGEEITRRVTGPSLKISSCQRATPHQFEEVAGLKVYRAVETSSYA